MNPIILNMEEMSDSTEVYSTRPSPIFAILIYFLAGALVLTLIWAGLFRIDIVTRADGIIRHGEATATITNLMEGRVISWSVQDGEYVQEGDVLFSIDPSELKQQEERCLEELENIEERLAIMDAYYRELDGETGALGNCSANRYYEEFSARFEAVQIGRDVIYNDTAVQQSQYENSISAINKSIDSLTTQQAKLEQMIHDVRNRTNSFAQNEVYYYAAVEGYINSHNYTANQYDIQIRELEVLDESEQLTEGEEEEIAADNSTAIEELNNQKALALNQIETEMIASIQQSLASVQGNIEAMEASRNEAEGNINSLGSGAREMDTDQLIVNEKNTVYTEINTYKGRKTEYEDTLNSVRTRIEECNVKAQSDGYLNLSVEKTDGDYISAGEHIGTIIPESEGTFKVVIYVENQDIGSVHEGQKIRYDVASYPQTENYGIFEGKVTSVSKDIRVDNETGTGYYEVEATIAVRDRSKGKESPEFIQGMAVRAKLVTGQESVLQYLLEKIDLVDK